MALVVCAVIGCARQGSFISSTENLCQCRQDFQFPQAVPAEDSFYIRGDCRIEIPSEKIDESYSIKMFYQPVSDLYIQGDHLLMGKAIIAGGSGEQFWLWIRHKEVDSFWYGPWQNGCVDTSVELALNPSIILEAMGLQYCQQDYKRRDCACNAYVFNRVLPDGSNKSLWFDCCDEKLRKIEILAADGSRILLCLINNYFTTPNGYQLPSKLEVTVYSDSKIAARASLEFKPDSFDIRDYSDKFAQRYFSLPEPSRAENVYKMLPDGRFLKVSSD